MRLRPEQLQQQLQDQLLPLYLVFGDENLLVQEACDAIRARCREQGCNEREVLLVENDKFDWNQLLLTSSEMSLFADRKLIELRIPGGKPGTEGSKALQQYLENPAPENILLIVAGKIDKQSTNTKWFKALDKAGALVQVYAVKPGQLPGWMRQRMQQLGLQIDNDALQLLCDRVEGNLLAAAQEIEKLRLLCGGERVSVEHINQSVADNARYNLFALVDHACVGQAAAAFKMFNGLRAEGTEAAVVLWALSRELRSLYQCQDAIARGQSMNAVFRAQRIWDSRKPVVSAALNRHSLENLAELLRQATLVDHSIKGLADGQPWERLSQLLLSLATGVAEPNQRARAS
jgi:DNA polymerase-3 subunit delta